MTARVDLQLSSTRPRHSPNASQTKTSMVGIEDFLKRIAGSIEA
jgi:hypothetical protein